MKAKESWCLSRREFLRTGIIATLSAIASGNLFNSCRGRKGRLKNWAWISAEDGPRPDDWKKIFLKMKEHRVEGALVLAVPEKIKELIPLAQQMGIELQNWIISLECTDPDVKNNHPD